MKKKIIFRIISAILSAVTIAAIICAATVKGGGFLDLSNIVRVPCICIAVLCAVLAVAAWKYSGKAEN